MAGKWVAAAVVGLSIGWASGTNADIPLSAMLKQAANLAREGEYEQAMAIYKLTLDSPEVSGIELRAYVLNRIADVNIERGMYTEAVTASNEAITLLRQAHKEHTGLFAIVERVLADALYAAGYDQEARNTATEALALARQTLDTRSLEFTRFLTSLGQILKGLGKFRHAEELCQSALQILQRMQAADKVDLASAYQNVAVIQTLRGHPRKALVTIELALATWSQVPPPQHPSFVYALCAKLTVYDKLRAFRQGEELMPHLLALGESVFGHNYPERVILLNKAAVFYVTEKKYGDAEPLLREASDIARHQLAAGHPLTRSTLLNYSYVLAKLNRKDEAARVRAESDVVRASPSRGVLVDPTQAAPVDRQARR